jgi:RNA polymerase sigma factor (sigma-70 family)
MRTEDGHIVRECLDGDSASFGLLVDKYKASIYALAYSRLHNFHDAEDVTQDVFLKAYKSLRSLRRWDSFLVWLRSITINLCKDRIRAQSRRPDREFIEDQRPETLREMSLDPRSDEDALTAREEMLDSLGKALDSLPEIYQQVLMLHYLGGMSGEQISQFLGISHATVRQRLSRARRQLREEVLATMNATFEENRLRADFTFRIVEAVKRVIIHPVSNARGLPFGLSIATGIILAVLIVNPRLTVPEYIGIPVNSPLPSEAKVLRVGEIPVDVMKVSKAPFISSGQSQGNGGKPKLPDPQQQNAIFLAPQGEGDTWTRKADMPTGSWGLSTTVVDGKIYAFGGNRIVMEEYDPEMDTWIVKKFDDNHHPVEPTLWPSMSAVDGIVYIIGGFWPDDSKFLSTVQAYDPATNEYTERANMPTARCYLSTSVIDGKIYAIGGWLSPTTQSAVAEYDPATDTWTKKANMPTARRVLSTRAVNGKIYAIGGYGENDSPLSTVEEYDPVTDTWIRKADMPTARAFLATSAVNGKIYAIGGQTGGGDTGPAKVLSAVEVYDPKTDTWMKKADMPIARGQHSASAVNGKIYAIGGWNPAFAPKTLSFVEEYTPESWPFSVLPSGKLPTKWGEVKSD